MVRAECAGVAGFSLIEIAVTLFIVGLLAVTAVPFTLSWTHGAQVQTAKGQVVQAYGQAKAIALRNKASAVGNEPAAELVLDDAQLKVCSNPDGTACAGSRLVWSATLPDGVQLMLAGSPSVTRIELDNTARPVGYASVAYRLEKGSQVDDGVLY